MPTSRVPTQTWVARHGRLYMATPSSVITFSNSATLSGSFAGTQSVRLDAAVKNITVTPPETAWEKQDLLGKTSANFQNQLLDEKPVGIATLTATLVLGEDETVEDLLSGSFASAPSGYSRYQYGTDNTSSADCAAVVSLEAQSLANYVAFAFDNARFTKLGDTRIAGPDGHWEQDFTVICLAKDFYYEFKN